MQEPKKQKQEPIGTIIPRDYIPDEAPSCQCRNWRTIFGKNVRRVRQQRRLTQEALAFEAEIDLTYVGGIERGKRNPSLLVMGRIAKALSVPLSKLLTESSS